MSENVIARLAELISGGTPCVMAVLVKVEGSAPRHLGAKMLILGDGSSVGTIGGGALESAAISEAPAVLASGEPKLLSYDLRPDLGMMCGGRAQVYLEPHIAPPRLYLFGAGHVGQAVCPVAASLGFAVTVVDDRAELTTGTRFPQAAALIHGLDPAAWEALPFHSRDTYCVVATMGHATDTEVVAELVNRPLAYLGMIGSVTKRRALERELSSRGVAQDRIDAIRTPMGLDIGAETPAEIAVSIAAELVRTRREAPAKSQPEES